MENICEFCTLSRPIVYCKADAAHLCLSCDAKVHSANALSNRHLRTLLCESCRYRPAYVRCFDHRMFLCRGCDRGLHKVSSQHQKRVISSFTGCPSAKDIATLWGFDLNELGSDAIQNQFVSTSSVSMGSGVVNLDIPRQCCPQTGGSSLASKVNSMTSVFGVDSEDGLGSRLSKVFYKDQQQQNTFILQQIFELKRLQVTEGNSHSCLIRGPEQTHISSSRYNTSGKPNEDFDQHLQHSHGHGTHLRQMDSPHQEPPVEPFPLPFSQLEHLTTSSTAGIPLHGEPFWHCKSPVRSSQLWSQNMQDLGVCEQVDCFDDFDMPDVDLTFRNFEELFGGDQDPTRAPLDVKDVIWSSMEKDMSFDKSDNGYARATEGISVASSVYITRSAHVGKDIGPDQAHHFSGSVDSRPIRPSYSTSSFSLSRLSAESSATDYLDTGLSPKITIGEPSSNSPDLNGAHLETRENAMMRYKEKRKVRQHEKQNRHTSWKARSDVQKRVKGQFVKVEGYESDTIDATRSY